MLEGLAISEVYESEVLEQNDLRLEADYWVHHEKVNFKTLKGEEIISFVQYGTSEELNELNEGYPILRLNEFDSFYIGIPSKYCKKLTKDEFESLKLVKDDVLICRTNGNPNLVGKCAIVPENTNFAYASYLFKIRPKKELISSKTLVSFLNSKYGRKEIDKYSMTSNQTNFSPAKFREIDIPIFGEAIQNQIDILVDSAFIYLKKSKELYSQGETLLLAAVGLQNFEPSAEKVTVKSFKDSFLATGRLDAEYYQKKYEEVINHIAEQSHDRLNNIVNIKKSIEPGSDHYSDDEGLPFYRVSDYNKFGLSQPDKKLTQSFVNENQVQIEKLIPKKETILFAKDGSVGAAYLLRKDLDGITSGAILQLNVKDKRQIMPEYLTLVLNSKLVQMQAERDAGGSIILHWRKEEIENVVVPIIDFKKQQQISALVEESFRLKKESEELLELAKRMVEVAIEEGEEKAMGMLNII